MAVTVTGDIRVFQDLRRKLSSLGGDQLERAVTEMLISAQGYAAEITPVATSNLINSQYRKVTMTDGRVRGELGYGADYAIYVHEAAGKLKGLNVPRSPKRLGTVWAPNGEPRFLEKGVAEMIQQDADAIIRRTMKL